MKNSYNLGVVLIFFIFRLRNSSFISSIKFIILNFSLKKGKWKKIEIKKENIHTVELLLYIYIKKHGFLPDFGGMSSQVRWIERVREGAKTWWK